MTRSLLVAGSLLALTACHPPSLRSRMASLGSSAVKLAGNVDAKIDPHVREVVVAAVEDQARQQVSARIGGNLEQAVEQGAQGNLDTSTALGVAGAALPTTTTTIHASSSKHAVFALRAHTAGKDTCEAFTTADACNASCTTRLRAAIGAGGGASCSCVEQSTGC